MLVVQDLTFRYTGEKDYTLQGASFSFPLQGITAMVGESGVGKSTLIALIAGIFNHGDPMVAELSGEIAIGGRPPNSLRGAATVSWVPQVAVLLDHLTVIDNVLLPVTITRRSDSDAEHAGLLLDLLGLKDYCDARPRDLSGGTKTRVSLARALVSNPRYLFLDEPFVGLDLMNRWKIYGVLWNLRAKAGLTTILTTHNIPEATILADRIVVIKDGADLTKVSVTDNTPSFPTTWDPGDSLRAAREAAAPIESQIFLAPERVG